jgi:hypothetical protein
MAVDVSMRTLESVRAWSLALAQTYAPAGLVVACLRRQLPCRLPTILLLNASYAPEWLGYYLITRADRLDPVLQCALATGHSFVWRQADTPATTPAVAQFMARAACTGLHAGAVGVCTTPDGWLSLLAVAGPAELPYTAWRHELVLHACHAHDTLRTVAEAQVRALPFADCELRVLHGYQCGLTDTMLAALTGVTPRTIRHYLWRMLRRTGFCRSRALALAAQWQPISLALTTLPADLPARLVAIATLAV